VSSVGEVEVEDRFDCLRGEIGDIGFDSVVADGEGSGDVEDSVGVSGEYRNAERSKGRITAFAYSSSAASATIRADSRSSTSMSRARMFALDGGSGAIRPFSSGPIIVHDSIPWIRYPSDRTASTSPAVASG
jgi:hypothetical protein